MNKKHNELQARIKDLEQQLSNANACIKNIRALMMDQADLFAECNKLLMEVQGPASGSFRAKLEAYIKWRGRKQDQ